MQDSRRIYSSCVFRSAGTTSLSISSGFFCPFTSWERSPHPLQHTLLWVGMIVGSSSLSAAITSTFWGSLAHRFSPKMLYLRAIMVNVITFVLMGFTTNLYLLLALSIVQGLTGGVSTIGMILVSSSSEKENIPANIGLFQSVITLGQLTGPPLGSLAAGTLGYRGAFIGGAAVVLASFVLCCLYVTDVLVFPEKKGPPDGLFLISGSSLAGCSFLRRWSTSASYRVFFQTFLTH